MLLESPSNTITCPECKRITCVNGEGLDGLQVDIQTIGLVYTAKTRRGREEIQNANTENNTGAASPQQDKEVTLKRALDDALAEAIKNQSELQSVYEDLVNGLQSQIMTEKMRLKSEITEMTKKAVALLQERKMTLMAELDQLEHVFSESHAMLQKVEEKKKCIESAIAEAKSLQLPLLQEHCGTEKVLEALLAPVDMQTFDMSCLNKYSGLRCCLDKDSLKQSLSINQGKATSVPIESAERSRRSSESPVDSQSHSKQESRGPVTTPPNSGPDVIIEKIEDGSVGSCPTPVQHSLKQILSINQGNGTSVPIESAERSRRLSESPVDSQSHSKQESRGPVNTHPNSGPDVIIEKIEDGSVATPVQPTPVPKQDSKRNRPPKLKEPPRSKDKVCVSWVVVSHVVNPGHFYVRYVSEAGTEEQLHRIVNSFCFGTKGLLCPEHTITKGDMLFAFHEPDGWQRVKVLDVHQHGSAKTVRQCNATEVSRLDVFFLDRGFQKILEIQRYT
ncbi:RING finger protein 17-like [Engraulis encrasicolus]|uniref:RING finger protein 17-like n=1 Tax=Engraulis encrasicolus TaxID=184585 RepID=UPI002FD2BC36